MNHICDVCGGHVFSSLGIIGRVRWIRCRECGADNYYELVEDDLFDDDSDRSDEDI